ncbi:MAG: bifunctional hydroxymethylpyrimidine kinase/phosphomethylpyrimidine kinase [Candidatus Thermoplasmatota archaeon]|nr:bifunctional hydroxymethylpyrimidine kinase/phosphomethylpyrimidine kinase [Candidatus Thermoplasmatota archaeon]
MANALTIAGSDSVGGAGLQADLKAFEAVGVHGCSVVTAITSQNTQGVSSIFPVPASEVASQLRSVLEDVEVDAVKMGMLFSPGIVKTVAGMLKRSRAPIVVDPVLASTTGSSLHAEGFVDALVTRMMPLATLVTPNIPEATRLSGVKVKDERSAKAAGREILEFGPKAVLVKGGHLRGSEAADYLIDGKRTVKISSPRIETEIHGTGCAFASMIAGGLALGLGLEDAVRKAKGMMFKAILARETVGVGVPCANPLAVLRIEAGKPQMLEELERAGRILESLMDSQLLPEVGSNMGYAVLGALDEGEVAAFDGRITRVGTNARKVGCARFGVSKHVARIVLAASSHDPETRCALNIKYSEANLAACRKARLRVSTFDRTKEPKGVSSMTWGVHKAIEGRAEVPDIIFDEGGRGKEPMIRVLGKDPQEVVSKLRMIIQRVPAR